MSATNRTPGARVVNDDYPTPPWAVLRFVEAVSDTLPWNRVDGMPVYWLEPCAGSGQIIRTVNDWLKGDWSEEGTNVRWHACEINPKYEHQLKAVANPVIIGDFLRVVPARYSVVLTNPPFALAEEFLRACLPIATHVCLLLRLNWVEGRDELLRQYPADVWVLPNRPPFGRDKRGKISTDAATYAWFHFWPGATRQIRHLARTPRSVRSAYVKWLDENLPRRETDAVQAEADPQQPVVGGIQGAKQGATVQPEGPVDPGDAPGPAEAAADRGGEGLAPGSGPAGGGSGEARGEEPEASLAAGPRTRPCGCVPDCGGYCQPA